MKFSVRILLLLFVTFLSTPTVVSLIEKNCDISIFFTMTEEEESHKELKVVFNDDCQHTLPPMADRSSAKILFENLSRHDNVSASIFSPPPEQV